MGDSQVKRKPLGDRQTILLASVLIMTSIVLAVLVTSLVIQYRKVVQQRGQQLLETVKVQVRFIEAIERFCQSHRHDAALRDARAATIAHVLKTYEHYRGFGETGELVLAHRQGEQIVFLLRCRHAPGDGPPWLPWSSQRAEPMRRALSGRSGTCIALDYRGHTVLAAHAPVAGIGMGAVAKVDVAEIRAPFIRVGIVTGLMSCVIIAIGWLSFFHIANPMVARIERRESRQRAVRKKAERALKRAHTELQQIFHAADPLCVIDRNNDILRVNDTFCRLFQMHRADVLGKKCCDVWHSSRCHSRRCALRQILGGAKQVDFEMDHALPGGTEISCHVMVVPYFGPNGQLVGIVKNFTDITQRKRTAQMLREKNADLETLLYVTSHDLREPLRTIQSFAALVDQRYADRLDEKGQDFLKRIVRGAGRLDRLVDDILTLSRAQRTIAPNEWVDAEMLVDDVLQRLETAVQAAGATVRVADPLPRLFVDRVWATQAVYNLVANALKFKRGGEPPRIEIDAYDPPAGEAVAGLAVGDRGPGVPPECRQRIFELFQRAVGREVEGTGAGLAIVSQIARRHGGAAWVEPRSGGGSKFIITFALPKEQPNGDHRTGTVHRDRKRHRDLVGGRQ
jgi:PAS domain S-box-containing protein